MRSAGRGRLSTRRMPRGLRPAGSSAVPVSFDYAPPETSTGQSSAGAVDPRWAHALSRMREFWGSHRRLVWMLHSTWALITGTGVVLAARERYHLVVWVMLFLTLTWASTLFFGTGAAARAEAAELADGDPYRVPSLAHEITSYVTRILYQETLFFLLPFYAYSTVFASPNVVFLVLLGGLAVFSCIDLVFDRWLRTRPVFGLSFFAGVAFAALNLLLPLFFGLRLRFATPAAATLALAAALPLAQRCIPRDRSRRARWMLAVAGAAFVAVVIGFPQIVPPVPLRVQSAGFAPNIDGATLTLEHPLPARASVSSVGKELIVLVHVFAPSALSARVNLEWRRDGRVIRVSRDIGIVAHPAGFRVWDRWRSEDGDVPPGHYEVILRTRDGRVFGAARLDLRARTPVEDWTVPRTWVGELRGSYCPLGSMAARSFRSVSGAPTNRWFGYLPYRSIPA